MFIKGKMCVKINTILIFSIVEVSRPTNLDESLFGTDPHKKKKKTPRSF